MVVPWWNVLHAHFLVERPPLQKGVPKKKPLRSKGVRSLNGEGGIRTLDRVAPIQHFQCCAFDHSATSPVAEMRM
jgi:hypothetical protein